MAQIELKDVLKMHPLERPIDLQGASVYVTFADRSQVMRNWEAVKGLLYSLSPCRERRSWKWNSDIQPIDLIVKIEDGNEIREFPGWDFEVEALETVVQIVGAENVQIEMPDLGKPCEH